MPQITANRVVLRTAPISFIVKAVGEDDEVLG